MKKLKLRKGAIVGIYTAIFVFTGVGAYLVEQPHIKRLEKAIVMYLNSFMILFL